jgi:hypothetical protein
MCSRLIAQLHSQNRAFLVVGNNGVVLLTANLEAAVPQTERAAFVKFLLDVAVADRKMNYDVSGHQSSPLVVVKWQLSITTWVRLGILGRSSHGFFGGLGDFFYPAVWTKGDLGLRTELPGSA